MTLHRWLLALLALGLGALDAPAQMVVPGGIVYGRPRLPILPPRPRVAVSFSAIPGGGFYYSAGVGLSPLGFPRRQVTVFYGRPLLFPPPMAMPGEDLNLRPRPLPFPRQGVPPADRGKPPAAVPPKTPPRNDPGPGEPPPVPQDAGS